MPCFITEHFKTKRYAKMRFFTFTTLLLFTLQIATAQDTASVDKALTYEEALAIVIDNNETLKQAKIKIEQREAEKKAKSGLFLPSISLSGGYFVMTDDIHLDLTPVQEAIDPLYTALGNYGEFSGVANPDPTTSTVMPTLTDELSTQAVREQLLSAQSTIAEADWTPTIQEQSFGLLSANFTLPIYAGGKVRIANKAAKINIEEASAESRQKLGEVTMELVERYYGLLLAQKVDDVRQEVMQTMKSHMEDAEKMKNQGLISNTEFLQAKVYYTEAKREKAKAERQVSIVNDALNNTLALPENTTIATLSSFFYHEELESLNHYKSLAEENSPLLKQIALKEELLHQQERVEKGDYLPSIAAMGTYTLADYDLSPYIPQGVIGIGLNWSLFEGNARNKTMKSTQLQKEQLELYYAKSKSNIETVITKHYNEAHMHLEQIRQLDVSKEFALDYLMACEKSFKEGLMPSSEVSDASLLLAKIQIEQLQATYNYDVALSKLLYYAGVPEQYNDYLNTGISIQ